MSICPPGGFQSWLNIPTTYAGAVVHSTPPNLNLQGTYQTQTICLPSAHAGTTRRLVLRGRMTDQPVHNLQEQLTISG
ncbi:MAG: hypothetical protein U0T81_18280 [Saprospiraceae bacterium]